MREEKEEADKPTQYIYTNKCNKHLHPVQRHCQGRPEPSSLFLAPFPAPPCLKHASRHRPCSIRTSVTNKARKPKGSSMRFFSLRFPVMTRWGRLFAHKAEFDPKTLEKEARRQTGKTGGQGKEERRKRKKGR